MAMLPDPQQMDKIEAYCLALAQEGRAFGAVELAQALMALESTPLHAPCHHFLVPAALLTAACLREGRGAEELARELKTARSRAGTLPGGMCGQFGSCGAALGAGVFAAVRLGTTPTSKSGWAAANAFTARCLAEVASVEGPRCCKRVTLLTLRAALPAARELLGLELGEFAPAPCAYSEKNRECRGAACPFFPAEEGAA